MAGIGGIVRAVALATQTGFTIADIINTETDGEAYYPSIKENKKKLSELEPVLDSLKATYVANYNAFNNFSSDVGSINAKAVVLLTKLGLVLANAADAQKLAKAFAQQEANGARLGSLPKVGGVFFDIVKVGEPILAFGELTWQAVSLIRASNSAEAQFLSLKNHLSNVLKGTDLPTNTLRTMKVSKVEASMMVLGLGMAATSFGLNVKEAELKRDKYEEFVKKVQTEQATIQKNIDEISKKQTQIQDIFDETMKSLKEAFKALEDQVSIDKLEAAGRDTVKINGFEDEMIPKMDALIKVIESNKEKVRLMGLADSLIPALASSALTSSNFISALKSIKPDIKDEEIATLISESKVNTPEIIQKALENFNHKT